MIPFFLQLLQVQGQSTTTRPAATRTTGATSTAPTSTSLPGNTLTQEQRAQLCTQGSTNLVNAYKQCFPIFPTTSQTMQEADQQAWNFVTCICDSNWKAGTPDQIRSSVPVCPAIPGITKGQQASVGADCHGSSVSQKMKVIQSFGLRTFVKGKPYVPLSGFPPGVLSSDVSYSWISTFLIPAVLVFF